MGVMHLRVCVRVCVHSVSHILIRIDFYFSKERVKNRVGSA